MKGSNGNSEVESKDTSQPVGAFRRIRQPLFEKDLMTAGMDILDSLPTAVFKDEQAVNDACLYLGWLAQHLGEDSQEVKVALWKINATMAIGGRARKEATMAHGNLYYPEDASKEDKKWLSMMQQQKNTKDNDENGGGGSAGKPL